MTFLMRLLFILSLLFVIRLVISKLVGGARARRPVDQAGRMQSRRTIQGKMVRDPQCGMYVATSLALPATTGGETFYFCSKECRTTYLQTNSG